jgi:hypothetical protein
LKTEIFFTGDPLSPRRFPAFGVKSLFSNAYVSMRCGLPVEISGFRWKPEGIHSYKIDYSSVGAWGRAVLERWRDLGVGIGSGLRADPYSKSGREPPTDVVLAACRAYGYFSLRTPLNGARSAF